MWSNSYKKVSRLICFANEVWDSASNHHVKDLKIFFAKRIINQIMIPAGMTAYLQTLDIAINKPFKDYAQKLLTTFMGNVG